MDPAPWTEQVTSVSLESLQRMACSRTGSGVAPPLPVPYPDVWQVKMDSRQSLTPFAVCPVQELNHIAVLSFTYRRLPVGPTTWEPRKEEEK